MQTFTEFNLWVFHICLIIFHNRFNMGNTWFIFVLIFPFAVIFTFQSLFTDLQNTYFSNILPCSSTQSNRISCICISLKCDSIRCLSGPAILCFYSVIILLFCFASGLLSVIWGVSMELLVSFLLVTAGPFCLASTALSFSVSDLSVLG